MAAATASEDGARTSWRLVAIYDTSLSWIQGQKPKKNWNKKKKNIEMLSTKPSPLRALGVGRLCYRESSPSG